MEIIQVICFVSSYDKMVVNVNKIEYQYGKLNF